MPTIIVGISGPSSSGKTTLARLLRQILLDANHKAFIVHEDDFYVTDKDIPIHAESGYQDWDCLESIDAAFFERTLQHIKTNGELPSDLKSKEDQNSVGKVELDQTVLNNLKDTAKTLNVSPATTIAIVDGFLLFTPALEPLYRNIDVRIFLPITRELMIARRSARSGYVTLEGFWEDPPGYVEKVVWPNYAKDHEYLFHKGNVEGELDNDIAHSLRLNVAPTTTMEDMTKCLEWAWQVLSHYIQR